MKLAASKFHFIGIGGIGMSGLAELMHNMGAHVSGSDLGQNVQIERLKSLGVTVWKGHDSAHVGDVDVVVYSSAVPNSNPEIQEARRKKIPIIARAEVLAEVMRLKRGIAVGGSHGKTTTTSLLASIFISAKTDPTIVVGGRLDLIKSTSLLGKGEWLIAEADESDGSFLKLSPEIAVITNIDDDHLDHYKSYSNLQKAFVEFAHRVPFYGATIVCGDDPRTRALFTDFNKRVIFYGFDSKNDYVLFRHGSRYEVRRDGVLLGDYTLQVPGEHVALNALAGLAAGMEAGLKFETCVNGISLYAGVDRRLQSLGDVNGISIIDDYGHHPTEVRVVLRALKDKYPTRRLVVCFQPHRYSRTQLCWESFKTCFAEADQVWMWDIYPAGEVPIAGITSEKLIEEIQHPRCQLIGVASEALKKVSTDLRKGDILLTLGAGDISKFGPALLERLSK